MTIKASSRSDVESFGQMLLAARTGGYSLGHGQGVSDAAFGRFYSDRRSSSAYRSEYDLGWRVGRFVLFQGVPRWRAAMLTHTDAADWWQRFKASREAKPGDPE